MNYKETLFLPKTTFGMVLNSKSESDFYEKSYKDMYVQMRRNGKNPFRLVDGPPYANGNIHVGHAFNKILKDFIVKYHYFCGQSVEFVPGWDCHGLPIEKKVRELKNKSEDLLAECRKYANEQVNLQKEGFKKLGVVADWDNPYLTMNDDFEKMILESYQELKEKGLIYFRNKPVWWSWKERTVLADAELEYKNREDWSCYIKFPVKNNKFSILIWTTMPWTIFGSAGVCLNPKEKYCITFCKNEPVLIAEVTHRFLFEQGIVEEYKKQSITGDNLRRSIKQVESPLGLGDLDIYYDEFVSVDTGTGCVHLAPSHGEQDSLVSDVQNCVATENGNFTVAITDVFPTLVDKKIFEEGNEETIRILTAAGVLMHKEKFTHNYPHCWRSGVPLMYRPIEGSFLNLHGLKKTAIESLENVQFLPEKAKDRLSEMVSQRDNWCLNRQRKWGVSIGQDILDVWFDSGLVWRSQGDADLYVEGIDQCRGWFQSSLWLSVALNGKAPYKQVLAHGFVVDKNGEKMSKSLGNVIDPLQVTDKYGAEVLRYWVASCDWTKEIRISDEVLARCNDGYKKLRNTFKFLLSNLGEAVPVHPGQLSVLEGWIAHETFRVLNSVWNKFGMYDFSGGLKELMDFVICDLNAIYLNSIKDRLYCDGNSVERQRIVFTCCCILKYLLATISPFFTYTCQEVLDHSPKWFKRNVLDKTYEESKNEFCQEMLFQCPSWTSKNYYKEALEKFNKTVDNLRSQKVIKDNSEIVLSAKIDDSSSGMSGFYKKINVADRFFGVSRVYFDDESLFKEQSPLGEFECQGDIWKLFKSPYGKCERCWRYLAMDKNICSRCTLVLDKKNS